MGWLKLKDVGYEGPDAMLDHLEDDSLYHDVPILRGVSEIPWHGGVWFDQQVEVAGEDAEQRGSLRAREVVIV